ncbi:ATP-binding protein [Rhodobacter sp. 24-YEA-8]|uniref:ATP-binding protein n=1 Tax=Rhodobacter sp. 24-YEA-8 TaxID=1884310 RepID=UPI00373FC9E3
MYDLIRDRCDHPLKGNAKALLCREECCPPRLDLDFGPFLSNATVELERRKVGRRIRAAKLPAVQSLASFDFAAIAKLNKMPVQELTRCERITCRESAIALGPSATGKAHVVRGTGLTACRKRPSRRFHRR